MSQRSDPRIRPAVFEDYDAILALWQAASLSTRTAGRDSRDAFRTQLQRFPTTYLVAETDQRMVGVIFGTHDERKGWINRLAVHPDHRGRGLAKRLIDACERAWIEMGIEIFAALVETDNVASTHTFEAAEYKRDIPVHYFHKRLRADI